MNRIPNIRRLACVLAGLASAVLAFVITSPAAFAYRLPPSGGGSAGPATLRPRPPGWDKHPPLPPLHVGAHPVITGGMPGWQITLIAVAAALAAASLTVAISRMSAARRRMSAGTT